MRPCSDPTHGRRGRRPPNRLHERADGQRGVRARLRVRASVRASERYHRKHRHDQYDGLVPRGRQGGRPRLPDHHERRTARPTATRTSRSAMPPWRRRAVATRSSHRSSSRSQAKRSGRARARWRSSKPAFSSARRRRPRVWSTRSGPSTRPSARSIGLTRRLPSRRRTQATSPTAARRSLTRPLRACLFHLKRVGQAMSAQETSR